jgi:DNA-binding NtrC family response regulator
MESFLIPLLLIKFAMNNNKAHIKEINDSRIFIVEDDDMHSLMMDYVLSNESTAHITKFKSGEDCIKHLYMNPDVVILDYGLPGINGIDTFKEIQKHDPDIPVIVITGNTDNAVARKFLDAGVYDYIRKEDDAFEHVGKITDKILNVMAQKEAKIENRRTLLFKIGFGVLVMIISVLSYVLLKH